MHIFGTHNIQNASYAYEVARQCGIPAKNIERAIRSFDGLEGRLQLVKTIGGVRVVNDNNSTTPDATIAGLRAVKKMYPKSNIILIAGGSDKTLDLTQLGTVIQKTTTQVILLSGTGTEKLKKILTVPYIESNTLKEAVAHAFARAKRNDVILFSPGFASFGLFTNEYDRNDQFLHIIQKSIK